MYRSGMGKRIKYMTVPIISTTGFLVSSQLPLLLPTLLACLTRTAVTALGNSVRVTWPIRLDAAALIKNNL